ELARMIEPRCSDHFGQRKQRIAMKIAYTARLVFDDERALPDRILGRDSCRALVRVTGKRLDTADRKHESAAGVGPVRPERHHRRDVERTDDLAGSADPDPLAKASPDQRV